jgi:hypothetical protein
MIYFIVAQKEEDGKWDVFGPWDYVDGADDQIIELEVGTVEYSQIDIARVLTKEDDPDKGEWLKLDSYEPMEDEDEDKDGYDDKHQTT